MGVPFPSGADEGILADEPVGHLVGLPLDARHALRGQLVAAELLQDVVAGGTAVDPDHQEARFFFSTGIIGYIIHHRPFIKYPFVPEETYFINIFT